MFFDKIKLATSNKEELEQVDETSLDDDTLVKKEETKDDKLVDEVVPEKIDDDSVSPSDDFNDNIDPQHIHNNWSNEFRDYYNPLPHPEGRPMLTEKFKRELEERNRRPLIGFPKVRC